MTPEKAALLLFRCPSCAGGLDKIGNAYGCQSRTCYANHWRHQYLRKLKRIRNSKRR